MTIGIGVLASEERNPDRIVLMSDTLGSFGDSHSTSELHKSFSYSADDFCAVAADRIDRAAELVPIVLQRLRAIREPRTYGMILRAVLFGANAYKFERFNMDCLPRYYITQEQSEHGQLDKRTRDSINEAYASFYVGCEVLIGAFDHEGQAFLFSLPGDGRVENVSFPGFAAIGSGAPNAMFWLGYRKHKLSCSLKRSAYHAYEAKRMAETSPHVNERIDIVLAKKGEQACLNHKRLSVEGWPVSVPDLADLFGQFNVRDTGTLDPADQETKPPFTQ